MQIRVTIIYAIIICFRTSHCFIINEIRCKLVIKMTKAYLYYSQIMKVYNLNLTLHN